MTIRFDASRAKAEGLRRRRRDARTRRHPDDEPVGAAADPRARRTVGGARRGRCVPAHRPHARAPARADRRDRRSREGGRGAGALAERARLRFPAHRPALGQGDGVAPELRRVAHVPEGGTRALARSRTTSRSMHGCGSPLARCGRSGSRPHRARSSRRAGDRDALIAALVLLSGLAIGGYLERRRFQRPAV